MKIRISEREIRNLIHDYLGEQGIACDMTSIDYISYNEEYDNDIPMPLIEAVLNLKE